MGEVMCVRAIYILDQSLSNNETGWDDCGFPAFCSAMLVRGSEVGSVLFRKMAETMHLTIQLFAEFERPTFWHCREFTQSKETLLCTSA
ncbi:MAG: hypothetical protein D6690_03970 [Nitrospirae bacterium]|nr:MAG: hypothetical protein D6690_03970 [Nitrospirota bacterium]